MFLGRSFCFRGLRDFGRGGIWIGKEKVQRLTGVQRTPHREGTLCVHVSVLEANSLQAAFSAEPGRVDLGRLSVLRRRLAD